MTFRTKDAARKRLFKLGWPTVATLGFHVLNPENREQLPATEQVIVAAYPISDDRHTHIEIEEPLPPASHFAVPASTTSDDLLSWRGNSMDVANEIASRRRTHHPALYDMQSSSAPLFTARST